MRFQIPTLEQIQQEARESGQSVPDVAVKYASTDSLTDYLKEREGAEISLMVPQNSFSTDGYIMAGADVYYEIVESAFTPASYASQMSSSNSSHLENLPPQVRGDTSPASESEVGGDYFADIYSEEPEWTWNEPEPLFRTDASAITVEDAPSVSSSSATKSLDLDIASNRGRGVRVYYPGKIDPDKPIRTFFYFPGENIYGDNSTIDGMARDFGEILEKIPPNVVFVTVAMPTETGEAYYSAFQSDRALANLLNEVHVQLQNEIPGYFDPQTYVWGHSGFGHFLQQVVAQYPVDGIALLDATYWDWGSMVVEQISSNIPVTVLYRPGTPTEGDAMRIAENSLPNVEVVKTNEDHKTIPASYLRSYFASMEEAVLADL